MGCCFSCFNRVTKSVSGEPNERTTLLGNPVSNSINRPLFSQEFPESVNANIGDEQAALNKILHQTTIDIIDVSAIPTHIEQKDYISRVKLYQKRIRTMNFDVTKNEKLILKDLPFPEKLLSEPSLLLADMMMMNDAVKNLRSAMKSVEIEPKGDIVSKFQELSNMLA